jgi:RNA polymerase sigma-70 factor, ECF subfamily
LAAESELPDDYDLMQRIAGGDPAALAALFDRHGALVHGLGIRMLGDRSEAEDFLLDVFFEIWRKPERYDANRGAPVTYLMTVARSRAIDRRRAARPRNVNLDDPALGAARESPAPRTPDPSEKILVDERCGQVQNALAQLNAEQRQVIEMSFYDGLSHSQIAAKLDKPLGTVKTYIRQGLIRLRDCLRKHQ